MLFDGELVENRIKYRDFKILYDIFWTDDNAKAEYKGKIYLLSSWKSWIEGKKLLSIQL